jgi:hypothetical protein
MPAPVFADVGTTCLSADLSADGVGKGPVSGEANDGGFMKKAPVSLCWLCNKRFQGNLVYSVMVDGLRRFVHKQCQMALSIKEGDAHELSRPA